MQSSGGGNSAVLIVEFLVAIAFYVFQAIAWSEIARKCGEDAKAWWAWVPLLNVLLIFDLADMSYIWLLVVFFVPFGGLIVMAWCGWVVCENIGKPGWIGAFTALPPLSFVALGYMAWGPEAGLEPAPAPAVTGAPARPRRVSRGGGRR